MGHFIGKEFTSLIEFEKSKFKHSAHNLWLQFVKIYGYYIYIKQ